jgi:hypothetical protein
VVHPYENIFMAVDHAIVHQWAINAESIRDCILDLENLWPQPHSAQSIAMRLKNTAVANAEVVNAKSWHNVTIDIFDGVDAVLNRIPDVIVLCEKMRDHFTALKENAGVRDGIELTPDERTEEIRVRIYEFEEANLELEEGIDVLVEDISVLRRWTLVFSLVQAAEKIISELVELRTIVQKKRCDLKDLIGYDRIIHHHGRMDTPAPDSSIQNDANTDV